jgi:hypothetical protein
MPETDFFGSLAFGDKRCRLFWHHSMCPEVRQPAR